MWQVVKPLRPHPLAVGQARNFCRRRLTSVLEYRDEVDDVVSDVATIASELVTNAVTAGASSIELFIALGPSVVRIEVVDDAAGSLVVTSPTLSDTKGRGLMIVAALAREWGVTSEHGRKNVWAEVDLGPLHTDQSPDAA